MGKSTTVQVGPGTAGMLTILFVLLKVFGKIDWSWWWVFSPLWIGFAIVSFFLIMFLVLAVIFGVEVK
jgi:Transmembrane Fragile-X-F protein